MNMWQDNTMDPRSFDHAAMIYMFCSDMFIERPRLFHVSCLPFSSMSFYPTMYDHVCCTHTCMHNRAVDRQTSTQHPLEPGRQGNGELEVGRIVRNSDGCGKVQE